LRWWPGYGRLVCVPFLIAGSRVEVIDDCGHVIQADQPERTWTAVSSFLAG
jgi:pimeloyl-ACP methyl ester carboxylesterase